MFAEVRRLADVGRTVREAIFTLSCEEHPPRSRTCSDEGFLDDADEIAGHHTKNGKAVEK